MSNANDKPTLQALVAGVTAGLMPGVSERVERALKAAYYLGVTDALEAPEAATSAIEAANEEPYHGQSDLGYQY